MIRPCFLVVDQEHAGAISSRKLVLETAKFNVITAYSCREALETLRLYPSLNGVVINGGMPDEDCAAFLARVAAEFPQVRRVLVGACVHEPCPYHDFVENFSPAKLLETLRRSFAAEAATLDRTERALERQEQGH